MRTGVSRHISTFFISSVFNCFLLVLPVVFIDRKKIWNRRRTKFRTFRTDLPSFCLWNPRDKSFLNKHSSAALSGQYHSRYFRFCLHPNPSLSSPHSITARIRHFCYVKWKTPLARFHIFVMGCKPEVLQLENVLLLFWRIGVHVKNKSIPIRACRA